jgi:GAF domain-containing protein
VTPSSSIADALATAARTIDATRTLEETLSAIAHAARSSIPGVEHAGISTVEKRGAIVTRATTGWLVNQLDDLQYSLDEGPCVQALRESVVVSAPHIGADPRWPRYVAEAVRTTGLRSQLAVRLFLDRQGTLGGLNLYSTENDEISPEAEAVAELFATHAAIALGKARELDTLSSALQTRKTIGQAIGIVMERYSMSEERAFAFLIRASSHGNVKLRDIAQELVDRLNQG